MGQRQRLRLAMAFLHEPRLVLLDEPRNSLDGDGLALLNDVVDDFVADGGTVVWCAPTGTEAPSAGAAVYLLEHGKIFGG
jgi:ABC-2 type transport system ATP-binding protein